MLESCWPQLTQSGADFAAMSDRKGAFRRCGADWQNVQITPAGKPAFGRLSRANMAPPLKLYQSDRSVRITRS